MSTFRVAEKMQVMTMATIGAEQISQKLCKAHLESFNLTRAVVFVGSTAVVTRVKESQAHQARGVLRLFVSTILISKTFLISTFRRIQTTKTIESFPSVWNMLRRFGLNFRHSLHQQSRKWSNSRKKFHNSWIWMRRTKFS